MSEREEDPKHPRKGVTGAHENFEVIEIEDQDSHGGFQGKMDYPPSHKLNQTYTPSVSSSSTSSRSTGSRDLEGPRVPKGVKRPAEELPVGAGGKVREARHSSLPRPERPPSPGDDHSDRRRDSSRESHRSRPRERSPERRSRPPSPREGPSRAPSAESRGSRGRPAAGARRSLPADMLHIRPKHVAESKKGASGQIIDVSTNYFALNTKTEWRLFHYNVQFEPDEERAHVRRALMREHRNVIGANIFDGASLFCSKLLPEPLDLKGRRQDGTEIRIRIVKVAHLLPTDPHYLQFYNILMRKCLRLLDLKLVGRNYFDPNAKIEIREYRLELWPGYKTSIRQHESGIMMCAEISHKVMRKETVLDILHDCLRENRQNFQDLFKSRMIGETVLTAYNNNTYRIVDVNFSQTAMSSFSSKNGKSMTYKDYYREKYELKIREDTQPLLIAKSRRKERNASGEIEMICLIPEFCNPTGLTESMRNDFRLMKALKNHTQVVPESRISKLMKFNERLNRVREVREEFEQWDMSLGCDLVKIKARVVNPERLKLEDGWQNVNPRTVNWDRDVINYKMISSVGLKDWVAICPSRQRRDFENFLDALLNVAQNLHFELKYPKIVNIDNDQARSYAEKLEETLSSGQYQLIFCVVSNNRIDRYSAIKKKCCIDRPIPSQVMLSKTINHKHKNAIATKVAIQMNCKIGGAPWGLDIPSKEMMIMGLDVCNDGNNKNQIIGALVSTVNKDYTQYFSHVSIHSSNEDLSAEIGTNVGLALRRYHDINRTLPSRIIIYRDGVSDGQIGHVCEHEIGGIKKKLGPIYESYKKELKLAYVIVTKRINTRFFYNRSNPPPGTIIDDVVTNPLRYDFFLISQSVNQGTVSPAYYTVVEDSTSLTPDQIQRLTFKLCHMYFNTAATTRVPAPCQYAHKLAFLISQALHREPSTDLNSTLYFL